MPSQIYHKDMKNQVQVREELMHIRLNKREKEKLTQHAVAQGITISELVRDLIKSLPAAS